MPVLWHPVIIHKQVNKPILYYIFSNLDIYDIEISGTVQPIVEPEILQHSKIGRKMSKQNEI